MNLTEQEGRNLFSRYGITVPRGFLASDAKKLQDALREFLAGAPDVKKFALKAQLRTGKRGKSGGIVFAEKNEIAEKVLGLSGKMIGNEKVGEILAVEALDIEREYFLSIAVDRFERCPVIIFSTEGGVDIEETAEKNPEKIRKTYLRRHETFPAKEFSGMLEELGMPFASALGTADMAEAMLRLFDAEDCLLAEINPLILTIDGKL
jgi:succinyl-CoA synthetase beta subunit